MNWNPPKPLQAFHPWIVNVAQAWSKYGQNSMTGIKVWIQTRARSMQTIGKLLDEGVYEPKYKHNPNLGAWMKHGKTLSGMKLRAQWMPNFRKKCLSSFGTQSLNQRQTHTQNVLWAYADKWQINIAKVKGRLQNCTSSTPNLGHFWDADIRNRNWKQLNFQDPSKLTMKCYPC